MGESTVSPGTPIAARFLKPSEVSLSCREITSSEEKTFDF
jgi:hypothetical protein